MNFTYSEICTFIKEWKKIYSHSPNIKTIVCPSFTCLGITASLLEDSETEVGAQNVCQRNRGAFTGEVSVSMLKEIGCEWVIIGHSERRIIYNETNEMIRDKLQLVIKEDLCPILCIGESAEERDLGQTTDLISLQLSILYKNCNLNLSNLIIAYEPIWAIGTGDTPTKNMIINTFKEIRTILGTYGINPDNIPIIYGGSVDTINASELSNIEYLDGFLIGGASLDVDKFNTIYNKL